jgi:hypothetical protein
MWDNEPLIVFMSYIWVTVGTMLRRRRFCRKKQFSAEAVRMR